MHCGSRALRLAAEGELCPSVAALWRSHEQHLADAFQAQLEGNPICEIQDAELARGMRCNPSMLKAASNRELDLEVRAMLVCGVMLSEANLNDMDRRTISLHVLAHALMPHCDEALPRVLPPGSGCSPRATAIAMLPLASRLPEGICLPDCIAPADARIEWQMPRVVAALREGASVLIGCVIAGHWLANVPGSRMTRMRCCVGASDVS